MTHSPKLRWLVAAVCTVGALLLLVAVGLPNRAGYSGVERAGTLPIAPEIGAVAPPFQAPTLDGGRLSLWALRGETVILNFWATWCVPCRVEMPELQALYEAHNVRVIGVNLSESPETVDQWTRALGLRFDIVLDLDGAIAEAYRLRGQPTTVVIRPDGVIAHIAYGATTRAALEAVITTLD